jgi:hypothetical protein
MHAEVDYEMNQSIIQCYCDKDVHRTYIGKVVNTIDIPLVDYSVSRQQTKKSVSRQQTKKLFKAGIQPAKQLVPIQITALINKN